jgi:hypothetical protein
VEIPEGIPGSREAPAAPSGATDFAYPVSIPLNPGMFLPLRGGGPFGEPYRLGAYYDLAGQSIIVSSGALER